MFVEQRGTICKGQRNCEETVGQEGNCGGSGVVCVENFLGKSLYQRHCEYRVSYME